MGSAGPTPQPEGSPGLPLGATMFQAQAFTSCAQWLWSAWPAKYPDLKVTMSESGIAWVAGLIDRLDNIMERSGYGQSWPDKKNSPSDVLRRNFWFTMIDDPSTMPTRYAIGVENIMAESDYPHGDGTWPDTQAVLDKLLGGLPVEEQRMIAHENAAKLYRHPLPDVRVP